MFTADELESNIQKAIKSIKAFKDDPTSENAVEADYFISVMRLGVGRQFEDLHWFLAAEREVRDFLDKDRCQQHQSRMKAETIQEVDGLLRK